MFRQEQFKKASATKKHFSNTTVYLKSDYPHRLNFYTSPPTAEVTLDQFEQWAIDRLRVLEEIETSLYRNKSPDELKITLAALLKKYLHLDSNSSHSTQLHEQRQKDHYSHFILRLAFARSEDLRRRFSKAETILFKHRFESDDGNERTEFVDSLELDWKPVSNEEKAALSQQLIATSGGKKLDDGYFKVDWERVPDLVEQRRVFVRAGKAYVPSTLQVSLVVAEFTKKLEHALELTARALPRLDEDDRLIPILNHLSLGFTAPEYNPSSELSILSGAPITAADVEGLSQHFPACMTHLHRTLRKAKHLKHFGRLQYGLFLKGIGLSVEEALTFWRTAFSSTPSEKFDKEYRYNVRHSFGLEGQRKNYRAKSCQQILTETPPGNGEAHGCPYRHFSPENLNMFLAQQMGVKDAAVLRGVTQDVAVTKFHMACNRVFEHIHREEIRKAKEQVSNGGPPAVLETIIHPNEYFVRSWELKHPEAIGKTDVGGGAGTRRAGDRVEVDTISSRGGGGGGGGDMEMM
ncbi:eukaryotic and archaeal DNA primase, large subunit-domain-containing protein [Tricharina praecox]|uniref:eukaryotic and archaeal DNA primase, large subunit-domain-containing protein n=1 Tax=Tricharina praecox TaxID=43433 RepID=UPI002220CBF4|nr:eukaryotic and archaeal DNA primase, large subunit-domain-containing protein [Tricharina praecox]KAI5853498.1 eukaryotic and archaeal DNA primase, large subunit-domain-containing protein [Tricharina praecox]